MNFQNEDNEIMEDKYDFQKQFEQWSSKNNFILNEKFKKFYEEKHQKIVYNGNVMLGWKASYDNTAGGFRNKGIGCRTTIQ